VIERRREKDNNKTVRVCFKVCRRCVCERKRGREREREREREGERERRVR